MRTYRCPARSFPDRCERPAGHTGTHLAKIGATGQHTWPNLLDSEVAPIEAAPIGMLTQESEMKTMDHDTKTEADLCATVALIRGDAGGWAVCRLPEGHKKMHRDGKWRWGERGEFAVDSVAERQESPIPLAQVEPVEEAPFTRVILTVETEMGIIRNYERTVFRTEDDDAAEVATSLMRETAQAIHSEVGR